MIANIPAKTLICVILTGLEAFNLILQGLGGLRDGLGNEILELAKGLQLSSWL